MNSARPDKIWGATVLFVIAVCAWSCSSCSDGDNSKPDASPDTDSDTDSDVDTDTGEPDWGDTTTCANAPGEDEVCIPGGKYLMGCVPGDTECEDNEKPLVLVELSPFFIEKYEAQLAEVIEFLNYVKDLPGYQLYPCGIRTPEHDMLWVLDYDPLQTYEGICPIQQNSSGDYEFNPDVEDDGIEGSCWQQGGIEAVAGGFSWLGAKMFCEWKGMQLPTEAQWEAAARGQTMNEIPCGTDPPECWYGYYDCHGVCSTLFDPEAGRCCYPFTPEKAGELCLSPFGVNGMYGNAYEWTADHHDDNHAWASGLLDPQQTNATANPYGSHIAKGGCVDGPSSSVRISARSGSNSISDTGFSTVGVRCVRLDEPAVLPDAGVDGGQDGGK